MDKESGVSVMSWGRLGVSIMSLGIKIDKSSGRSVKWSLRIVESVGDEGYVKGA